MRFPIAILFFSLFLHISARAQTSARCTSPFCFDGLGVVGGIPYYFMNTPVSRIHYELSYQIGLTAFKRYKKTEFYTGLSYTLKNYENKKATKSLGSYDVNHLSILDLPVVISYPIARSTSKSFALQCGIVLSRPFDLSQTTYSTNEPPVTVSSVPVMYKTGASALLGTRYSARINTFCSYFAELNTEYLFIYNHSFSPSLHFPATGPVYQNISDDRWSINFHFGVEFSFRK